MSDIRTFLETRRRQLSSEIDELVEKQKEMQSRLDQLERERLELDRAAKAIGMVNGLADVPNVTRRQPPTITIKEAVRKVLRDHPQGLTALQILSQINARFGLGIVRTSLSPQLTRLKNDEEVQNSGTIWVLTHPDRSDSS